MLHDRDATTLARVRRRQRPMMIAGALLFLLGAVYSLWTVDRLHGTPAAEETNAFDRPIAAFAQSISAQRDRLDRLQPVTSTERSLLAELRAQADYTGRLLLFVLRFLVGSVVLTVGLMLRHDAGPAPAAEHFSPLADLTRVADSCRTGRDTGEHAHPSRRDAPRAVARHGGRRAVGRPARQGRVPELVQPRGAGEAAPRHRHAALV